MDEVDTRPVRTPKSGSIDPLTAREIEVLEQLATMLTVPEIAAALFVSVNTVKAHLKSIYRKLAVSSRRQAVTRAVDAGLISGTRITRIG